MKNQKNPKLTVLGTVMIKVKWKVKQSEDSAEEGSRESKTTVQQQLPPVTRDLCGRAHPAVQDHRCRPLTSACHLSDGAYSQVLGDLGFLNVYLYIYYISCLSVHVVCVTVCLRPKNLHNGTLCFALGSLSG